METKARSFLKALCWRLIASAITGTLVFFFTREPWLSLGVGLCDSLIKILVYFLHERVWTLIPYGVRNHPLHRIEVRRPLAAEHEHLIRQKLGELGYLGEEG